MKIDVLTIFPELFDGYWAHGIIKRAISKGKISAGTVNIRDFAEGKHRVTDDRPYGGGCGMVMKPEPLAAAIRDVKQRSESSRTVLLTPQGTVFNQVVAERLLSCKGLILVCGRYEGVDERIADDYIDEEISIGDFVLTGGELAAMAIIDAVVRLIPGVLGGSESAEKESFSEDRLEHAHYTRPDVFEGNAVPEVLLSGNHGEIARWRLETSLIRTFLKRRDLLIKRPLTDGEKEILRGWMIEIEALIRDQSLCGTDSLPGNQ